MKDIPVRLEEMLELDRTNMTILRTDKNYPNTTEKHSAHLFSWKLLLSASANNHFRKVMEASMIALNHLTLNEQFESHRLLLFQNGVN